MCDVCHIGSSCTFNRSTHDSAVGIRCSSEWFPCATCECIITFAAMPNAYGFSRNFLILTYWASVFLAFLSHGRCGELRLTETPYRAPNLAVAPAFWVLFANQFASFSATIFLSSAHFFWATSNISANSCGVNTPLNPFCSE